MEAIYDISGLDIFNSLLSINLKNEKIVISTTNEYF